MTIRHYGWPSSPFSAKTRAYLKSVGVDFQDIQPHVLTLYRRIQPAIGYVMMPTVELSDGTFLQDSSRIIDHFEALPSTPTIVPVAPKQRLASALLEIYADEWLPLIAMCTRWTIPENRRFAQSDFGRCAFPWLPSLLSRPFAKTMANKMSSYLPVLGITEDTTPEILSWLQALAANLMSISAPSPISLVIALRWQIFHSPHHSLPMFGEIRALGITSKTTQTS